jgi:hypothetical protein
VRVFPILAAAALALTGCTDGSDDPRVTQTAAWSLMAANPLGPPVDCIEQAEIRGHAVRDSRTIDFSMEDGRLLRTRLPFACPGLTRTSRFTYKTALPRLCSVDQITLIRPDGSAGGNCGLGSFQPIAIPARQGALPRR